MSTLIIDHSQNAGSSDQLSNEYNDLSNKSYDLKSGAESSQAYFEEEKKGREKPVKKTTKIDINTLSQSDRHELWCNEIDRLNERGKFLAKA